MADIEYAHLFYIIRHIIRDIKDMVASCECKDCKYVKRTQIYFKLLKNNRDEIEAYSRVCDTLMSKEPDWFIESFIHSFLDNIDEDDMMEKLFDNKDDYNNGEYVFRCNVLKDVKKFKNYILNKSLTT
jgi:hypothetical protein